VGEIVNPLTKGDQAEQKAAVEEHRAAVVALKAVADKPPPAPPTTKELPPTVAELQLIDRLRKGTAYGRDAFMLEVMLGHKAGNLDFGNALLAVIQHQQGQDNFAQDWSQRLAREQTTIRGRFDSLEKATSGECEELRTTITNATTRTKDHLGYLEDMVHLQHQFLVDLLAWLGLPWSKRFREDLPDLPERKPLEKYLAENTPQPDLPAKLKAAAETVVDLATQLDEAIPRPSPVNDPDERGPEHLTREQLEAKATPPTGGSP
jgi:hypothetical protein